MLGTATTTIHAGTTAPLRGVVVTRCSTSLIATRWRVEFHCNCRVDNIEIPRILCFIRNQSDRISVLMSSLSIAPLAVGYSAKRSSYWLAIVVWHPNIIRHIGNHTWRHILCDVRSACINTGVGAAVLAHGAYPGIYIRAYRLRTRIARSCVVSFYVKVCDARRESYLLKFNASAFSISCALRRC